MSPIARVFIVINLILSVAFVALAAKYLDSAENWRSDYDALKIEKTTIIEGLNANVDKLQGERDQAKTDYQTEKNKNMNLESKNKTLREKIQEGKVRDQKNSQEISEINGSMSSIKNTLSSTMSENNQLRNKEKAAVDAREEAESAKLSLEQQVAVLEREKEVLQEKIGQNLVTIGKMEDAKNDQRILIVRYRDKFGPLSVAQPSIEAKVMDLNTQMQLVTLSVGKDDGVKKGFTFDIFRGGEYKGRVTVQELDAKLCIAKYKTDLIKRAIQKGDSAKTNM